MFYGYATVAQFAAATTSGIELKLEQSGTELLLNAGATVKEVSVAIS